MVIKYCMSQDIPKPSAICQNISRRPQSFLCLASQHPTSRAPTPFSPGCLVAAQHPSSKFEQTQRDLGPRGTVCHHFSSSMIQPLWLLCVSRSSRLCKIGHGRNWKLEMPVKFPPENAMSGSNHVSSDLLLLKPNLTWAVWQAAPLLHQLCNHGLLIGISTAREVI